MVKPIQETVKDLGQPKVKMSQQKMLRLQQICVICNWIVYQQMQVFIKQLQKLQNRKDLMREACTRNNICTSEAGQLTPKKLRFLHERFEKAYKSNQQYPKDSWGEHQKRAFNWALIAVSTLKNVKIADFSDEEWNKLFQIFQHKSQNFLRYESRRFLLQKCSINKNWLPQENQLIKKLVHDELNKINGQKNADIQQQQGEKQAIALISWNQIAHKLFQQSEEKFFRTSKQCKQRWQNHLDPNIERGEWTREQQISLLESVEKEGKKWANLARKLSKTEHCVKNKYNSIISQQRKSTPSLRKQEKLLEEAKKRLKIVPSPIPEMVVTTQAKSRTKIKHQDQLRFDDNQQTAKGSYMAINQTQNKNKPDVHSFLVDGQYLLTDLIKEESINKNEISFQNNFWLNSPKLITPNGLTPSPMPFSYTAHNNYFVNAFMSFCQPNDKQMDQNK